MGGWVGGMLSTVEQMTLYLNKKPYTNVYMTA